MVSAVLFSFAASNRRACFAYHIPEARVGKHEAQWSVQETLRIPDAEPTFLDSQKGTSIAKKANLASDSRLRGSPLETLGSSRDPPVSARYHRQPFRESLTMYTSFVLLLTTLRSGTA